MKKAITFVLSVLAAPAFVAGFSEGQNGQMTIWNFVGIAYLVSYVAYCYKFRIFNLDGND